MAGSDSAKNITDLSKHRKKGSGRTSFLIPPFWAEFVEKVATREGLSKSQVYIRGLQALLDQESKSNSWDVVDDPSTYDPKLFYTASQDKKGHSAHLRVNIPKHLAGEMAGLVQSGRIPAYRSNEDIARDAIMHRVKQIAVMIDDEELEDAVNLAMMIASEAQIVHEEEQAEELVMLVQRNIDRWMATGQRNKIRKYVSDREHLPDSLPSPWSSQLRRIFREAKRQID